MAVYAVEEAQTQLFFVIFPDFFCQTLVCVFWSHCVVSLKESSNMSGKRRHKEISIADKVKIIEQSQKPGFSAERAGQDYGISRTTVLGIIKNKEKFTLLLNLLLNVEKECIREKCSANTVKNHKVF